MKILPIHRKYKPSTVGKKGGEICDNGSATESFTTVLYLSTTALVERGGKGCKNVFVKSMTRNYCYESSNKSKISNKMSNTEYVIKLHAYI